MSTRKDKINALKLRVKKAMGEWLESASATIEDDTKQFLDKDKQSIISAILGIRHRYGDFELDYNSSVGTALKNCAVSVAKEWIEKFSINEIPALSQKELHHLRKVYKDEYIETVEDKLKVMAQQAAEEKVEEVLQELLQEEE